MVKTNAMRMLDSEGISYETAEYSYDEDDLSGVHAAAQIKNITPEQCFKTLVARGEKNGILVYCIPVAAELDLKAAAMAAHDKRVELIHVKELQGLTGYIRGGCSPVGMKKQYPVYIDETAALFDKIGISAGQRGLQVILNPESLRAFLGAEFCALTR
jgi:Cys-tRNA(Pro)/Cys-tRNA(Cys) deacylase